MKDNFNIEYGIEYDPQKLSLLLLPVKEKESILGKEHFIVVKILASYDGHLFKGVRVPIDFYRCYGDDGKWVIRHVPMTRDVLFCRPGETMEYKTGIVFRTCRVLKLMAKTKDGKVQSNVLEIHFGD